MELNINMNLSWQKNKLLSLSGEYDGMQMSAADITFVKAQHFQRLLYLLKSVVHAGQDVAVPVDAAGESL